MAHYRLHRRLTNAVPLCVFALTLFLAIRPSPTSGQRTAAPVRILLTNDDGYDAAGIVALREALISGGHDVVVVAPTVNQSGSSARVSSGILRYVEASPDVWHVDGSPADAVLLALNLVMRDSPPDLVVSGTNAGQNIGSSTSHSGTVGAAVTAARRGLPALAISAEVRPASTGTQAGYISTAEAFEHAAQFALDLINQLVARPSDAGALLPAGTILNVNYPALPLGEVRGVRFLPVSDASAYDRVYAPTGNPGEVRAGLRVRGADDIERGTDVALLARGFITINLIDANGDAGASRLESVARRLTLERE